MKYLKMILCFLFLLPLNTLADELEIIYDCPSSIKANEEFSCQVKGKTSMKVSGVEYEFALPDFLSLLKFEKDSIWEGEEENNLIILYGLKDQTGTFPLGTITFISHKELKDMDIKTTYLVFCDDKYEDHIVVAKNSPSTVNKVENISKKGNDKNNIFEIYVIIILIILIILGITVFIIRKKYKCKLNLTYARRKKE